MTAVKGFRTEINFRDLGGYTAIDGRAVRNGLLYRSSAPGLMNEEELNLLRDMNIHTMMDFRSRKRCEELPDPELEGCERIQMCAAFESLSDDLNGSFTEFFRMLADEDQQGNMTASWVASIHASLVYSNEAYYEMFRRLLRNETPLLFHCTQGKDRTGIAALLILLALGVNEKQIEYDYLLSNRFRRDLILEKARKLGLLHRASKNVQTAVLAYEGVLPEAVHMILAEIQERYGNYETFLREEYDLKKEDLETLRSYYLE